MSLYRMLNELSQKQLQDAVHDISRRIIKDPKLDQEAVWKSLSVLETIVALNTRYDFNQASLILDQDDKYIVQESLERYFNTTTTNVFLSNHPSDVLGVSLAISLQSKFKTLVLMDDFSMNYGKSFESLIQLNNHKPNLNIVFLDPYDSFFEEQPILNAWMNNLRLSTAYTSIKKDMKSFLSNPMGQPILNTLARVKDGFKGFVIEPTIFTQFGFNYHGPINGNDLKENLKVFKNLKDTEGLNLIHVNSNIERIKNLKLPTFKVEDGLPENYVSYLDAIDEGLTYYDDLIVCCDISKDSEHMPQFAIKYPDHYYVSTGTIQAFVDFAKGLLMQDKRVVFIVSSYQFKHVLPLVEEQLSELNNILFILRDAGLKETGNRITQGIFDIAYSSLITENIYMGKNLNEAVGLMHNILKEDSFSMSILRIPNSNEKNQPYKTKVDSKWEVLNEVNEPKGIIFTYGPVVSSVLNKVIVNHLNILVVNCKHIFEIDNRIVNFVNEHNLPCIIYDLEDYHHTLYRALTPYLSVDKVYNFNLKNTDLNLNARDLKRKYQLNVEHILSVLE